MRYAVTMLAIMLVASVAGADTISPFNDAVADNSGPITLVSLDWGITYSASGGVNPLVYGTTTRYYNNTNGATLLWPEGDPVPGDIDPLPTSSPKAGDVGSKADNNLWGGPTDISSIDALPYQQTIFDSPVDVIFVFERGGNDSGTIQPILVGGGLGAAVTLDGSSYGSPIANGGTGQNTEAYVYQADVPIMGIQINASGHDSLTIAAIPEPATLTLLGLAGLLLVARRRRS